MNRSVNILLVEDEVIISEIIENILVEQGYFVTTCLKGMVAWNCLQDKSCEYDLVLLDRILPDMDGMELFQLMKNDLAHTKTPVIFETARIDRESIQEGLNQGAYYYLTKPINPDLLLSVVEAALNISRELKNTADKAKVSEKSISYLQHGCFLFQDLETARLLANYLAHACPNPEKVILGLQELMLNAIEHGNLGISYSEKGALIASSNLHAEIQRRLELPEYRQRYAEISIQRFPNRIQFTISDQGLGFNWSEYMDFSADRAFDPHGRGIALARKLSFDDLTYTAIGNTVTATVNLASARELMADD